VVVARALLVAVGKKHVERGSAVKRKKLEKKNEPYFT
jgi:hypothetical protein